MKPQFTITNKMLNLTVDITQKVTQLEFEQKRSLRLRKKNRVQSIHSSLAIENNSLTLDQVTDIINGKAVFGSPKEIREVINAYDTYDLVFKMNPYSIDDFLYAHRLLTNGLVMYSGRFRDSDVGVYDTNGSLVHLGARPQYIHGLIEELFSWAKNEDIPNLIKSCAVHFEIEMIHPFSDGNGRMGRLWQNLILSKSHQVFEWIPIETIIHENQMKYYDMLMIGDKNNDSTEFIEFMLEVISDSISGFSIMSSSEEISKLLKDSIVNKMNDKEIEFFILIYPTLSKTGYINTGLATSLSEKSSVTVRRYLVRLAELGILSASGKNKYRRYTLKQSAMN